MHLVILRYYTYERKHKSPYSSALRNSRARKNENYHFLAFLSKLFNEHDTVLNGFLTCVKLFLLNEFINVKNILNYVSVHRSTGKMERDES